MNINSINYREDIDGLRAVAVLSVIAYHFCPSFVTGGFVGVDIFFVISGFLISGHITDDLIKGRFSFVDFYVRRTRRIFPALALVLSVTLIIGWFTLLPDELKELGKHAVAGVFFTSNLLLWTEAGYFDRVAEFKPLLHLWSLGVEEQFYILWPYILWLCWGRFSISKVIATLLAASFIANIILVDANNIIAFYSPFSRLWELAAGALLAQMMRISSACGVFKLVNTSIKLKNLASVAGFCLIFLSISFLRPESIFPGWNAAFPVLGATMIIWSGMSSFTNRLLLINPMMVFIGKISYPLYLWHWPLLAYMRILTSGLPSNENIAIAVIACLILAILTTYILEPKFRFGPHGMIKAIGLIFMMFSIAIVGMHVVWSDGYPKRSSMQKSHHLMPVEDVSIYNNHNCSNSREWPYHNLNHEFFCMRSSDRKSIQTTAIIGDSHAYPMYFGFYETIVNNKNERLIMVGAPGCPPIYNVESFEKGSPHKCLNLMGALLDQIKNDTNVDTVVLVARGPLYISGSGYGNVDKHNRILQNKDSTGFEGNRNLFISGMENTILTMQEADKRVVVVLSPPELGFEPKECFNQRPFNFSGKSIENCGVSYQDYLTRSGDYRRAFLTLSQEIKNLTVIDPERIICVKDYCNAYLDGELLYSDNNHLSASGALRVVREGYLNIK